jgi:phospholipid/cholesterol/gamma-HCH transport system substrate-binding protein
MRRLALIGIAVVALGVSLVASSAEGDGGPTDDYQIRAFFDNAGFLVKDEEVRIAGATVGTVESVDVTQPGEAVTENGDDYPGKAVAVLNITDPGFQDFRTDATCIIRPQSLLGEKFVECKPTEARSALTEPPSELSVIPDGEAGEGQRFLPLENNGKAVDIDLVNNIYREPEVDKFRLILNDLGAGLAARGDTLGDVIERANPALQQTDKVLAILAEQNQQLAQLQVDSDAILEPLAREKEHIAGFINNATIAGEAAAERRADMEQGFVEFPNALRELELTMVQLRRLSEDATPVAADLRAGASSLAGMTEALGPFARAGTSALTTLGDAAEASGPDLVASKGLIKDLGKLGKANEGGTKALDKLLSTLRRSGGRDQLFKAVLGLSNAINGYDDYGHFLRAVIQINNCANVTIGLPPGQPITGCGSKWTGASASTAQTLTGEAAINANPTPEQIGTPLFDELEAKTDVKAEEDNAGKLGQRQRDAAEGLLGKRQSQAAQDLLGFLTEDGR